MTQVRKLMLFGVRSPLLPDYEETCRRADIEVVATVRTDALRPRILDRSRIFELADLSMELRRLEYLACAFSPKRRKELSELAKDTGLSAAEAVIDPTAVVASSTRLGAGSFINASVVIGAAGMLGEHVFVNRSSNIGHHAYVEDFVSIGPGCTLSGNVRLGEMAFIGAGSVILPGVQIGKGAVVAAGSVVRSSVPDGVLVAGAPAVVKRQHVSPDVYGAAGEE